MGSGPRPGIRRGSGSDLPGRQLCRRLPLGRCRQRRHERHCRPVRLLRRSHARAAAAADAGDSRGKRPVRSAVARPRIRRANTRRLEQAGRVRRAARWSSRLRPLRIDSLACGQRRRRPVHHELVLARRMSGDVGKLTPKPAAGRADIYHGAIPSRGECAARDRTRSSASRTRHQWDATLLRLT